MEKINSRAKGDTVSHGTTPRFCFICGSGLEECGYGLVQCQNEKCGEVFLPLIDEENNQSLTHKWTPFSPR